jgi:hypothetical protein
MRKTTLTILAFFLCLLTSTPTVQAQTSTSFGVKAGGALANLRGDIEGTSSKFGFTVGGFANIDIGTSGFAVQPELLFIQKGADASVGDASIALNYIQVPVLAAYEFDAGSVQPMVFAGPALAFKVSESVDGVPDDADDQYNSIDFSLPFGAGIGIPVGNGSLMIDARFDLGLANVADVPDDLPDELGGDASVQTSTFVFTVGYAF